MKVNSDQAVVLLSVNAKRTIQVANLLAILLIIGIHYRSAVIAEPLTLNYVFQELLCNGIARSAVPLFAFVSGLLYFSSYKPTIESYKHKLISRARTLLIPYLISSCFFLLAYSIIHNRFHYSFAALIHSIILHPISSQMWFVRDLIILILLSPLLYYLVSKLRLLFIIILFFIWLFNLQFLPVLFGWYLIDLDTLFFFTLGCLSIWHMDKLNTIISLHMKHMILIIIIWICTLLLRIYLYPLLSISYSPNYSFASLILQKVSIMIGLIALLSIASRIINRKIIYLSGYTFFAFLFHKFPLENMEEYTSKIIEDYSLFFYLLFPAASIIVFTSAFFFDKLFPRLFLIITGSRSPEKALRLTQ